MDYERIFWYSAAAIVAIFGLYKTQYLPWRLERGRAKQDHDNKASEATQEYEHGRELQAFSHTVQINENLVTFNIQIIEKEFGAVNERLDGHEKVFYTIQQHIARGAAAIENSNRAAVASAEREDDIEQLLHTILELLRTTLSRNGTLKTE